MGILVTNQQPQVSSLLGQAHKAFRDLAWTRPSSLASHPLPLLPYAPVMPLGLVSPPLLFYPSVFLHHHCSVLPFLPWLLGVKSSLNLAQESLHSGNDSLSFRLPPYISCPPLQHQCINLFQWLPSGIDLEDHCILSTKYIKWIHVSVNSRSHRTSAVSKPILFCTAPCKKLWHRNVRPIRDILKHPFS